MRLLSALFIVAFLAIPPVACVAQDGPDQTDLATNAVRILKDRCYRCHGGAAKKSGIDVLSRESLLKERDEPGSNTFMVVPGQPDESQLLDTLAPGPDSYMPKSGSDEAKEMTDAEKDLLRKWVEAGAEFPRIETRPFLSETQVLQAMRDYLLKTKADDRPYTRFYTLTHLYNNPSVSELDLRLYRAALSKAVNSLTWSREVVLPKALPNTNDAVYVINLQDLGWDRGNLWGRILSQYPYGLKYDFVKDEELKQTWKDVAQFSGADMPFLRADWFIVSATQPPLYHELLSIPDTLMELEQQLQLNIEDNILHGNVERSGYTKSGVSQQNRLLERHTTPVTPYFWISYDFLPRRSRGDLTRFPLGPVFNRNEFNNLAFEHDGGEIIWALPNGMQGYMLVDAKGDRIDQGPIEVVFDRSAVLGNPAIVNGISCMYCHRHGMITDFRDELRHSDTLGGRALEQLQMLHPEHDDMQRVTKDDGKRFEQALERVIGPFLKVAEDKTKEITSFPEPVGEVAEMYFYDLTPEAMALELGFEDVKTLQAKIEANRDLLRFGLGVMTENPPGTLKRAKWETRDGTSLMQDVASQLRLGLPFVP